MLNIHYNLFLEVYVYICCFHLYTRMFLVELFQEPFNVQVFMLSDLTRCHTVV